MATAESFGIEGVTEEDRAFTGSRFSEVRDAIFANPYAQLERFPVTLGSLMRGMLSRGKWQFLAAARRSLAAKSDLRWGPDRKGYRRLLHPNGICLTGLWEVTEETPYSGYFRKGSRGLLIVRYSTCCTETRRGFTRSLAMVGRIYPTTDPNHPTPLPSASFITQEDIGGAESRSINDAVLLNAPDTTPTKRGSGLPILLTTGLVLKIAETQPTIRQVYQIAELGKAAGEPTRAPEFFRLTVAPEQPVIEGDAIDFRDEIRLQIERNKTLKFIVSTSDTGSTHGNAAVKEWRTITNWKPIGTMTFDAAVASYNGDHVFHVNHPAWRDDRNDPKTQRPSRD
ncbi:MAG TPA: hypothetical protein VFN10_19780 [Thermoanaerobaculia bacterium]|nr:hypothetical protein [Thermoanaerobaculia bacterium]